MLANGEKQFYCYSPFSHKLLRYDRLFAESTKFDGARSINRRVLSVPWSNWVALIWITIMLTRFREWSESKRMATGEYDAWERESERVRVGGGLKTIVICFSFGGCTRASERANKHTKRRTEACDDASLELQNDFVYNDFFLRSLLEWIVECGFGT